MVMSTRRLGLLVGIVLGLGSFTSHGQTKEELVFWQSVSQGNSVEEYGLYIRQYPMGRYAEEAKRRIAALNDAAKPDDPAEAAFWDEVKAKGEKEYYEAYLQQYPQGRHANEARRKVEGIETQARITREHAMAERLRAEARAEAERLALAAREEAERKLATERAAADVKRADVLAWERAKAENTWLSYAGYLAAYPEGLFAALAKLTLSKTPLPPPIRDCAECPEMVAIPAGRFEMGANDGESDERPVHTVSIARPFALGKTEVTQGQWKAVMGNNPSRFTSCGDECPVENVSWDDVKGFILKLNARTGKQFRLPSEAEWEYAARAGTTTKYTWGNEIGRGNANCNGCGSQWDNKTTAPVGSFRPNAFGLYDMHGNVWEWTDDCWNSSYSGAPGDGSAWASGNCSERVLRGGSWVVIPQSLRAADRSRDPSGYRGTSIGFRLARTLF